MAFSPKQCIELQKERRSVSSQFNELLLTGITQSQALAQPDVQKHLNHGVGRRISVIKKALEAIFQLFPPSTNRPLKRDVLSDVQINLHAFVLNVSGIFDNWAWAFLFRHGLIGALRDRRNVSIFKEETQRLLPTPIQNYLLTSDISKWHEQYLKGYRDALMHRIPLYIPPASWTDEDKEKYDRLEDEKAACIRTSQWDRLDKVWNEQDNIGSPCFMFLHEYSPDAKARPLVLHPQLLSDSKTVLEFGNLFYASWHEHT